eukprot:GEMP01039117.1.p1 GENE.GEMP01039117.1~~GEMP01039117.1.p1  ORF type:complete len:335 (+),score=72.07 GEMP01039117.1:44-1048(+)
MKAQTWILRKRPAALPRVGDLVYEETTVDPVLKPEEVLLKTLYISMDPAMRGWMNAVKSYIAPVPINGNMRAGVICEVIESQDSTRPVGMVVEGLLHMTSIIKCKGSVVTPVTLSEDMSPTLALGVLGGTGITAYFGFFRHGRPKPGDEVLVSAAAGATGSVVCQLAKLQGCRVVGVAGGEEKCAWLKSVGVDEVIDYKASSNLAMDVTKALPRGFDIFFDCVGGDILGIAMRKLKFGARIVICGQISNMNKNAFELPALPNYMTVLVNKATVEGFAVFHYKEEWPEAVAELTKLVKEGKLKYQETIIEGLENGFDAFLGLFSGKNKGKMMVKL